jgi:hypothetical protein
MRLDGLVPQLRHLRTIRHATIRYTIH